MKLRKPLVVLALAGVVAALVVGGTAFAQTPAPDKQTRASYHELFLDRLASALGTTREKLTEAFTQARNETVDQQVQDGRLTQERADRMKSQQGMVPFGIGPRGFDRGAKMAAPFRGMIQDRDVMARALGLTPEELASQLRSGKTLAELAAGKEQAVRDAMVDSMRPKLEEAVKNGRLTQEQADRMLEQIRTSELGKSMGPGGMDRFKGDRGRMPGMKPSSGPATSGAGAL